MKTSIALALLFIFVLAGSYYWRDQGIVQTAPAVTAATSTEEVATDTPVTQTATVPVEAPTAPGTYTSAQVAAHASATSCWSSINGGVYDLTSFITQHPGGEGAILTICGKDGSAAFNGQHGDDGRANAELTTFKIGTLAL